MSVVIAALTKKAKPMVKPGLANLIGALPKRAAEFASFTGKADDKKLVSSELIRAIRFAISSEFEAIQQYMQIAESTDNKLAAEVLKDVADEERVHVGEFSRLLKELAPDEQKFFEQGFEEVEKKIKKE